MHRQAIPFVVKHAPYPLIKMTWSSRFRHGSGLGTSRACGRYVGNVAMSTTMGIVLP